MITQKKMTASIKCEFFYFFAFPIGNRSCVIAHPYAAETATPAGVNFYDQFLFADTSEPRDVTLEAIAVACPLSVATMAGDVPIISCKLTVRMEVEIQSGAWSRTRQQVQ